MQRWSQSSRSAISRWVSFAGKKAALARADRLLKENLSGAQKEQLKKGGYFEVIGGRTGKRYRIRRGSQMNVEELDENGRRNYVLCFMPEGHLADGDVMLAQKVALELFEFEALNIANRIPRYFPRFDQSQGARARAR